MKPRFAVYVLALLAISMVLTACSGGIPKVDWELRITGAVTTPLTLSFKDLAQRQQVPLQEVLMRKSQGEDTINSWEGPALDPILQEAGISPNAKTIICTAADGYAKEIPMTDLDQAIIALKMDGEWSAGDEHGPIRIVVPSLPANSWLFQLVEIEIVE